jgi:hypothetical protein
VQIFQTEKMMNKVEALKTEIAEKQAELAALLSQPAAPPCPSKIDDLNVSREELTTWIAELEQRAAVSLRILADTNEPKDPKAAQQWRERKADIQWNDQNILSLEAAKDRLQRWDTFRTYKLWQADEEYKRNGPTKPNRVDDLNCSREEIAHKVAELVKLAAAPLTLLCDPAVPEATKERIRREDPYIARLNAEGHRLERWEMFAAWKQWKAGVDADAQ